MEDYLGINRDEEGMCKHRYLTTEKVEELEDGKTIVKHITTCDFCGRELDNRVYRLRIDTIV